MRTVLLPVSYTHRHEGVRRQNAAEKGTGIVENPMGERGGVRMNESRIKGAFETMHITKEMDQRILAAVASGQEPQKGRPRRRSRRFYHRPVSYTHLDVYKRQVPTFDFHAAL